jgi:hypothetical protein
MSRKRNKLDDLMEAISFAEVGEIDTAHGIAAELFREKTPPQAERILTVSRSAGFSRRLVEQSLGMAERMGYGLVALSVAPAMARLVARLRGRPSERGAWLPPEAFQARAAERGVPFVHAVGKGDPEQAVVAVTRRFRRIAFLLVEPELVPKARLTSVPLPVFYLDPA